MRSWITKSNLFALASIIMAVVYFGTRPVPVDWSDSYNMQQSSPYATEVLNELLPDLIDKEDWRFSTTPIYNQLKEEGNEDRNYLFITSGLYLDSLDFRAILQHAAAGNQVMIASEELSQMLLDTLDLYTNYEYRFSRNMGLLEDTTATSFSFTPNLEDSLYTSYDFEYYTTYELRDSAEQLVYESARIDSQACLLRCPFGKGEFILCSVPRIFTNFHLLRSDGQLASHVLSFLDESPLIIDQYYIPGRVVNDQSILRAVIGHPSLRWGYWITIIGLLVYVLFAVKRKQRVIPIIDPLDNRTREFAQTIGMLYFNSKDNQALFKKKISHFKEYLREHYFMKDIQFSGEEARLLSQKSGKEEALIKDIFERIIRLSQSDKISDHNLSHLNQRILKFKG